MFAVAHYLATKPDGAVLVCLIVSIVLFVVAGVVAGAARAWTLTLVAAGLAFVVLAFLL